jgi:glyoxylase-like metal-dependent hydrolase (beta-lactamase superfamily II)/ferredoxin
MAQLARRLPQNVPGDFYVDESCIDCDACRQIAPETFRDHGGQSSVYQQPATPDRELRALMALVACPTASIGTAKKHDVSPAVRAFPSHIGENVYFCGFTAESSFGAWSYLIERPASERGNVLVDCPRFTSPLVRRIAEAGGISTIFLSHRDDIADHSKYAAEFGAARIMHENDGAERLGIERVVTGDAPFQIDRDLLVIPTPGHTRGHMVLLYKNKFLFTGDHLAWDPDAHELAAFRDVCWYSWPQQTRSMERLLDYRFEWVLPGHGRIHHDSAAIMHQLLENCVLHMKKTR